MQSGLNKKEHACIVISTKGRNLYTMINEMPPFVDMTAVISPIV